MFKGESETWGFPRQRECRWKHVRGEGMKDRKTILRFAGMASMLFMVACLLLAMGVATGIALFERTREPAEEPYRNVWRESSEAGETRP
jgi:hypothetical protein